MSDRKHKTGNARKSGARKGGRKYSRRRDERRFIPVICLGAVALLALAAAAALMLTAPRLNRDVLQSKNIQPRQATVMAAGDDERQVVILAPAITQEPEAEPAAAEATAIEAAAGSEAEPFEALSAEAETEPEAEASPDGVPEEDTPSPDPTMDPVTAQTVQDVMAETAASLAVETEDYLPVYHKAETMERKIAITVDDCFQVKNLQAIIKAAYKVGGKLTLFPIGENISKEGMVDTLKICVFKLGYEIENHTWSHARIFRLPEAQMAAEIWNQSLALNRALGVNYKQHFFRFMGGDGSTDQRSHNYLKQLGYRGVADWSVSGSDASMDEIMKGLEPGAIYLFHTTDEDTEKLKIFIPYAVSQGYELVTLNELLGFKENTISDYAITAMPSPRAYTPDYRPKQQGEYAWVILQMQDRLRSLGYLEMEGASTGYYGEQTAEAILAYQLAEGLSPTGVADSETQKRLLGRSA